MSATFTPVSEFVIKRSVWLRGEGAQASMLLRPSDNKQCCVGIYLEACGVSREALEWRQSPSDWGYAGQAPEWLLDGEGKNTEHSNKLYGVNDDDPDEDEIARLFGEAGVTVRFED